MPTKTQKIEPYKGGQNSADHQKAEPPVSIHFHVSGMHNSGIEPDSLHSALGPVHSYQPSNMDKWGGPSGRAQYNPTEGYRKVSPQGKGKDVYSYGGAPNKKGDNALGKALNKVGEKSGYPKGGRKSGGGGKGA